MAQNDEQSSTTSDLRAGKVQPYAETPSLLRKSVRGLRHGASPIMGWPFALAHLKSHCLTGDSAYKGDTMPTREQLIADLIAGGFDFFVLKELSTEKLRRIFECVR